jgi:hypothetical protein
MKRFALLVSLILVAVVIVPSYAAKPTPEPGPVCAIQGINRADGTASSPTVNTTYQLVTLTGPGTFVSAKVYAPADNYDNNKALQVQLVIDGKAIVNDNWDNLRDVNSMGTPFGIYGNYYALIIGFQQPVIFNSSLLLSVTTGQLLVPYSITADVIYGQ